jgi:hypothetical protein
MFSSEIKLQNCSPVFKRRYRKKLVQELLRLIDVAKNPDWKPNVLDAIQMTSAASRELQEETIAKCFRKCWGIVTRPKPAFCRGTVSMNPNLEIQKMLEIG